jgi:periplasmic protein TonB
MINKKIIILVLMPCLISLSALAQTNAQSNKSYLYLYTDKLPEFKGGFDKMKLFLKQNLKWPDRYTDIQGTVLLSFIVTVDGDIANIKIEKSLSKAFDEEAKRVVKLMPKWIPGKVGNNKVAVKIYLPIDFFISY